MLATNLGLSRQHSFPAWQLAWSSLLGTMLVAFAFSREELLDLDLVALSNWSSVCVAIVLIATALGTPRGVWSFSFGFLLVFALFHFGLTFIYGLGGAIDTVSTGPWIMWFYLPDTREAIYLSVLGAIAYGLGVQAVICFGHTREKHDSREDSRAESARDLVQHRAVAQVGLAILVASLALWLGIVLRAGGFAVLVSPYLTLLDTIGETATPAAFFGIGIGLSIVAAANHPKLRRAGFLSFGAWTLIALPLGLRGEILYPVLAALLIRAAYKIPFSIARALLICLCVLSLISFIRDLREVGLQGFSLADMSASPQTALVELGGSLRPVSEVVAWHETGDRFLLGASYWAPFDRLLSRLAFGAAGRPDAFDDERISNVVIRQRIGTIGFSIIAEAYRNFGPFGVPLMMVLVGGLLGWMDQWPATPVRMQVVGVILFALLNHIRNDFVPVPAFLGFGFAIVLATQLYVRLAVFRSTLWTSW